MLKRGLQIFFVLLLITAIVVAYFYFSNSTRKVVSVESAFASEAALIRINNPGGLLDQLTAAEYFDREDDKVYSINSILYLLDKELKDVKFKTPYLLLAIESGNLPVVAIENYTYGHADELLKKLKTLYAGFEIVEKNIDHNAYFGVYEGDSCVLCLMNIDGVTFISDRKEGIQYVAKIMSQNNNIHELPHFYGTANDNATVNLFVNGASLQKKFLNGVTSSNLFDNVVLDLYFKKKQLVVSGLGSPGKSAIMQVISNSVPSEFKLPGVIPDQIEWVLNSTDFRFDQGAIAGNEGVKWIKNWFSGDVVFFRSNEHLILGLNTNGPSVARRSLIDYTKNKSNKAKLINYKFDSQTSFTIIKSDFSYISQINPYTGLKSQKYRYAVVAGQYVLFSSSLKEIKNVCAKTILHQNLRNTYQFKQDELHLSSASNFIARGKLAKKELSNILGDDFVHLLFSFSAFGNLSNYTLQLGGSSGLIYTNMVFSGNAQSLGPKKSNWKSKLEKSATLKPVVVRNHINNEDEIFVQDEKSIVYLLNRKGRILWQKKLDGPILGDVYQVDRYKNNKLQYLFNTEGKIYQIDRNGNHVEGYPIELPSLATTGLALFDYENKRNYRMFVPLNNRMVNLYNIDGTLNPGWEFNKTDAIVTTPIQHFRVRSRDYIVFADSIRFYFLDRRGHERIVPSKMTGRAANSSFWFDTRKSMWITTGTDGKVISVSLKGEVAKDEFIECGKGHFFMFEDLTRNGKNDYIFVDGNKLVVFNHNAKKLFDYTFDHPIDIAPAYYVFSREVAGVGVVDKIAGKVYLFNRAGKQLKGFPYSGITPFTIAGLRGYKGFQLLVGNMDGYLYDYQLP